MRKLSLLVMLMFAFGYVFSQNISDVNQTGAQQDADVLQVGTNTSVINQSSDWSDASYTFIQVADVTQNGNSTSNVSQQSNSTSSADGEGTQFAKVEQYIGSNTSDIKQVSDNKGPISAMVYQRGNGNDADVDQYQIGGGSNGQITTTSDQRGDFNYIRQYEYAPGYNGGQDAHAVQHGDKNWGQQQIYTGHTESLILQQVGDKNWSDQYIDGGGHNHGEVYSTGNNNWAKQYIQGSNFGYMGSYIIIDQDGNNNTSHQHFLKGGSSTTNTGHVRQLGNTNTGNQYANAKNVKVSIKQIGNYNDGQVSYNPQIPVFGNNIQPSYHSYWTQYQESDNSELAITVYGNKNHTAQYQVGDGQTNPNPPPQGNLDYNNAFIYIEGDKNNSAQYQNGHDMDAEVDIYGDRNYGMTEQLGHENFADINIGKNGNNPVDGNCAGIYQNGDNLSAIVNQFSDGNWARVNQTSMGSTVDVTQR